jgi:hypothetical protein
MNGKRGVYFWYKQRIVFQLVAHLNASKTPLSTDKTLFGVGGLKRNAK